MDGPPRPIMAATDGVFAASGPLVFFNPLLLLEYCSPL